MFSKKSNENFKVLAYYPASKTTQKNIDKLRFDIITHVNYAFAIPTPEGTLRPLENPELAKTIIQKAHENNAKAMLVVGGWSYEDVLLESTFVEATSTKEKIKSLADEILCLCDAYGFDGVDIDWEYPRKENGSYTQYESLILYLAERLHKNGKLLTAAVVAGVTPEGEIQIESTAQTDLVLNTLDWINIMAYDGGDGIDHSGYDFSVNCGNYWSTTRNFDPSKVVLGVPFYGRPTWPAYKELLKNDLNASDKDIIQHNDTEVHYNGQETIAKKTQYAKDNLGGIMIWEITQDTSNHEKSLLTTIGKQLAG